MICSFRWLRRNCCMCMRPRRCLERAFDEPCVTGVHRACTSFRPSTRCGYLEVFLPVVDGGETVGKHHPAPSLSLRSSNARPSLDTDNLFPVFGFGGKLGPDQPANHAFAVNFREDSPEVQGMAGVMEVGRSSESLSAYALRSMGSLAIAACCWPHRN